MQVQRRKQLVQNHSAGTWWKEGLDPAALTLETLVPELQPHPPILLPLTLLHGILLSATLC